MAAELHKMTSQEALNAALNSARDALKVDLEGADINATIDVKLDSANDSVALKAAVETDIDEIQTDIALMKADIDNIRIAVEAVKVTTDKLDTCINETTDRIKVDVEASVAVPTE